MELLFVASECAPLVKTGGLADVIGSLPKALAKTGVRVRVLLPEYPDISNLTGSREPALRFENLFGGPAAIHAIHVHDMNLLVLSAPHLYRREGNIYLGPDGQDWPDNHTRFAALSYAGAEIAQSGIAGWKPDIVNLHDWQTGLLPAYLAQSA
ncbi:MAG: glycogen/starch synthase, partial [Rhodobacteraceae bacterium]|nr:glycogen/starch synthase [Paracoccaceae bacterium]